MRPFAVLLMWCFAAVIGEAVAAPPVVIAPSARIEPTKPQSFTVTLTPEMLQRKLALSLLARLDSPGLGGSTYSMQVRVNGKAVDFARLLNKLLETEMLSGLQLSWYGQGAWRVAYSPDYEAANRADHPACLVGGHAYDFVLQVADLLKAGENQIEIRHSEGLIKNALVIKDLALVDEPARVVVPDPAAIDPKAPLPVIAPKPVGKVAFGVQCGADGGLKVTSGKVTFEVRSSFSYPNAGWNVLGAGAQWPVAVAVAPRGDETVVTAQCAAYRLRRVVKRLGDHLAVSDELTNLTAGDLHVSVKHSIVTAGLTEGEVYLRGLKSRIMQGNDSGGDNPTVYVRSGKDGLGIVAEDDVLRAQCSQVATKEPAEAGLVDHYFMLPARGKYTLRWSLYPTPEGDYFDFVNAIRRNWGTNFTVPGEFAFAPHPTVEKEQVPDLGAWVRNAGLKIVSLQIPMPEPGVLSHGLAFLREKAEQARLKDQADRLRAAAPGLKVLQYLHVYITRLDEAVEAYKDARHLGADGKQLSYAAGSWKPTFWLFLPTTTNAYGREMNKTFDLVCDELGFDGVYWDELAYSRTDVAYGVHDGHSAMPNMETLTVQERVALTPLYCQDYQVQQARRVLDAGKILIGNGQPRTETMTKLHFPRFVEAWQPASLRTAHLYCPLGLSSPDRLRTEEDIVPSVRSHLENGGLWYYYYNQSLVKLTHPTVTQRMFPFTPIELHQGYLIGKERILTGRSGLFGWNDQSKHRVYVYGKDGREVEGFVAPARTIKGSNFTELRLPAGAVAVIERVQ
ncbi:MAG: hypothetical protein ABFE08_18135 [Armatimonadia bacterium]